MTWSANEPVAVFDRVTVRYGKKVALDEVSFTIAPGAVYALLGRNGMGKTSSIRCLLGHQKPTSGRISVFGFDSWKQRARMLERVGVVPEEPDAPPDLTPAQLAAFCSTLHPTWDAASVATRFDRFNIPVKTRFKELSKGQKGQVMLALALAPRPDFLVLDDPTLGLDAVARKNFFEELIGELADRGTTVLVTTHDLAGIEGIATHVGILKGGRLAVNDDLETLKAKFRRIHYINQTVQAVSAIGRELDSFRTVSVTQRGWGVEAVVANYDQAELERYRRAQPTVATDVVPMSLEEIFTTVADDEKGA